MSTEQDFYSKSGMMIFIFSIGSTMVFFLYLVFIHPGVVGIDKVVEPPKDGEAIPKQVKVEAVDPELVDKPWLSTPEIVAAGEAVYKMNCASCHGNTGKGDGIAATPGTRNLVQGNWKAGGTSIGLYNTISNGLGGTAMAAFKSKISSPNRWALVHYVRSITENKTEDDLGELESFAEKAN